ncbi:ankyrin repeat domain-containing protein 12-like [Xenia sp. Carnegie-2017]|uniref:ankyrin repeat domain-containing protein 12-like n=1 Tax=Xenia sp. Carnegie-2017 TaxID=2897299 RepID=UPI001F046B91|nr:ankyrin repeat domain-containing protein 12-like [Xenia sp. Carnegie-2017]XP_046850567.1 ankyrin repeat domain-containing protein 12-like [Xenia sp. Carnegie-2017]XP_046850568.1 ankyrin repeat domain-containing protein 12-like [Xenia sp. Carnegie-2017]
MNAAVFHQAVADGDATRVKFLINLGQQGRVNQRNKQGFTSLQQSCKDGKYEVAEVLLSYGANISATDKTGRTALHLASAGGFLDLVKLLIASCADVSAKDNEGKSAIDVAKSNEIIVFLQKAGKEKQPKTQGDKSEDWSKNVTSLPPGSRNSLVSNSSSDSGVCVDDNPSVRNSENKLSRPNGYGSNRGMLNDNRVVMGVLHESDEYVHEQGRERAHTTEDIGTKMDVYQENRSRSKTFDGRETFLQEQFSERLNDRIIERNRHVNGSHFSAGNAQKENQRENKYLRAQASIKTNIRAGNRPPRFRRSLSERMPSHQRRNFNGHRNISEELAALNLSRVEPDPEDYYEEHTGNFEMSAQHNPNEDLGFVEDIVQECDDYGGCSYEPRVYPSTSMKLSRNGNRMVEFYADEVGKEEWGYERRKGRSNTVQCRKAYIRNDFDDSNQYHRSQPRQIQDSNQKTHEIYQSSRNNNQYRLTSDRYQVSRNYSHLKVPDSHVVEEIDMYNSRGVNTRSMTHGNVNGLMRQGSGCSDTAVAIYKQRSMRNREYNNCCNRNYNCYYEQNFSRGLPNYEETMQRLHHYRESKSPTSRQISQV